MNIMKDRRDRMFQLMGDEPFLQLIADEVNVVWIFIGNYCYLNKNAIRLKDCVPIVYV